MSLNARRIHSMRRGLLRAFFKRGWFAAQMRQNFAGEMQRAGDQDRIWIRPGKHQRVANG